MSRLKLLNNSLLICLAFYCLAFFLKFCWLTIIFNFFDLNGLLFLFYKTFSLWDWLRNNTLILIYTGLIWFNNKTFILWYWYIVFHAFWDIYFWLLMKFWFVLQLLTTNKNWIIFRIFNFWLVILMNYMAIIN